MDSGASLAAATTMGPDPVPAYTPHVSDSPPGDDDYSDEQTYEAPPPYPTSLPETFLIGGKQTQPVVSISELQDHLRILGSFAKLRNSVVEAAASGDNDDADAAWAVFLSRAVHRFHRWVIKVQPTPEGTLSRDSIPPIDVLMVWHSYSLVSYVRTVAHP